MKGNRKWTITTSMSEEEVVQVFLYKKQLIRAEPTSTDPPTLTIPAGNVAGTAVSLTAEETVNGTVCEMWMSSGWGIGPAEVAGRIMKGVVKKLKKVDPELFVSMRGEVRTASSPQPESSKVATPPDRRQMSNEPAAGWHPDPTGRYEYRYWDGRGWTDHISLGGQAGMDPLLGTPETPGWRVEGGGQAIPVHSTPRQIGLCPFCSQPIVAEGSIRMEPEGVVVENPDDLMRVRDHVGQHMRQQSGHNGVPMYSWHCCGEEDGYWEERWAATASYTNDHIERHGFNLFTS